MPVPAVRAVNAKTKLVHVTVLHVLERVLERTIGLLALVVLGEESARGHALFVELIRKPQLFPFMHKPRSQWRQTVYDMRKNDDGEISEGEGRGR